MDLCRSDSSLADTPSVNGLLPTMFCCVTDVLDALTRISVQALQPVSLSQKALLYAVIIASNN